MKALQPSALQYSALQLAWLQELGIEKPWLPSEQVAAKKINPPLAVAPATVLPKRPSAVTPSRPAVRAAPAASPVAERAIDTSAVAASAHDLTSLAMLVAGCTACGLCRERQQAVTGEGVMQPSIMVIGEAPGALEDREGRPFVDRPGLMLDNMLTAIQSSRTHNVYVSNVVKCRPPGNRNPKPVELEACKPFLMRQIELVRPFSILAVGRAAQSLLETQEPLDKLRQVTHSLMVAGQNIPLIVTNHPALLLNHPGEKAAVWQDLQLLKTVSGLS
jgi:uracil-DNA glycosylase family 4